MYLIGIDNCDLCTYLHKRFPTIKYVKFEKSRKIKSNPLILQIKRILPKINPTQRLPVILNDDMTKIIYTDDLDQDISIRKIENMFKN